MLDGRMYYVDGVVRSAGNDLQNVVADDWRCLKLERSSLPDTAALCCGDSEKQQLVQIDSPVINCGMFAINSSFVCGAL